MREKIDGAFMRFFSVLSVIAFSAMDVLIFIKAVLRYVFNSGITQAEELCRYFFVWTCFMGSVVAYKENSHVCIDFLEKHLKGISRKILLLLQDIVILLILAVILYGGIKYTIGVSSALSPACKLPMPVLTSALVIAAVALIFLTFDRIGQHMKSFFKKEEL